MQSEIHFFKMKKIALILLISIYALSSFGIGIKQFYCCGKLKSTSITILQEAKEKCGMGDEKSGCCQTEFKILKVKDTHIADDAINNSVKHFSEIIIVNQSFETVPTVQQQVVVNNPGHAPPLHQDIPLYIFNCTYRI